MKKILLVGELNQTVSSVNKYLSSRFQTQICVDSLELVKGMAKVFEPDMVVVCLVGVGGFDGKILDFYHDHFQGVPVLLIGTVEECNYYQKYFEKDQYDFITRPTTLSQLMEKCVEMLHLEAQKEEYQVEEQAEVCQLDEEERKKRILIADDSGILLRSMKGMLDKQYEIVVATDGIMAIEKAKKKIPDLIFLDYEMPRMDGRETLEKIREDEELKDIPVVFLTGIADEENVAAVLKLKPDGYLLKPVEQQRLFDTIEAVLTGTL